VLAQNIVFSILAVAMAASAVRVVTTKNVVHAALYLVIVFAGFAGQYILLAAEFVAVVQVLVYIGAILVLLLFGVMLTRAKIGQDQSLDNEQRWVSAVVAVGTFGLLSALMINAFDDTKLDTNNSVSQRAIVEFTKTADETTVVDGKTVTKSVTRVVETTSGNNIEISDLIFSDYLVAFELSSIMLLAALVGAIAVARRD
jgi:NADH-quinone oxidoreductase subunit J